MSIVCIVRPDQFRLGFILFKKVIDILMERYYTKVS